MRGVGREWKKRSSNTKEWPEVWWWRRWKRRVDVRWVRKSRESRGGWILLLSVYGLFKIQIWINHIQFWNFSKVSLSGNWMQNIKTDEIPFSIFSGTLTILLAYRLLWMVRLKHILIDSASSRGFINVHNLVFPFFKYVKWYNSLLENSLNK